MMQMSGLLLLLTVVQLFAADTLSIGSAATTQVTKEEMLPVVEGNKGDSALVVESAAQDQTAESGTTIAPVDKKSESGDNDTTKTNNIRKIKLVKREYNYRQQLVLAIGMMSFIAIMMASTQSWNPK